MGGFVFLRNGKDGELACLRHGKRLVLLWVDGGLAEDASYPFPWWGGEESPIPFKRTESVICVPLWKVFHGIRENGIWLLRARSLWRREELRGRTGGEPASGSSVGCGDPFNGSGAPAPERGGPADAQPETPAPIPEPAAPP